MVAQIRLFYFAAHWVLWQPFGTSQKILRAEDDSEGPKISQSPLIIDPLNSSPWKLLIFEIALNQVAKRIVRSRLLFTLANNNSIHSTFQAVVNFESVDVFINQSLLLPCRISKREFPSHKSRRRKSKYRSLGDHLRKSYQTWKSV